MTRQPMTWQPTTRQYGPRLRALVIISTIAVALVLLLASAVQATGQTTPTEQYRVRSGDTLWEIATEHGPDDRDPRDVVEAIRRLNDMEGSIIHPGQVIAIPAG
jgi:LysM repeat protein